MKRSMELDILRGLAVLLVLFRHIIIAGVAEPAKLNPVLSTLVRGGWAGVDLFFVLSGYLVAGLLFKEYQQTGKVNIIRFLIRRGFKIYPPFYLLIISSLIAQFSGGYPLPVERFLAETFFLQNYFPGLFGYTWSLAVEEHFYLLLALVVFWRIRFQTPFKNVLLIIVSLCIGSLALRLVNSEFVQFSDVTHLYPTHLRIDQLAMGAGLSYFRYFHSEKFFKFSHKYRWHMFITGFLLMLPPFIWELDNTSFIYTFGLTLFGLGAGMWVMVSVSVRLPHLLPFRIMAFIGIYSYSIYIWHKSPIIIWMFEHFFAYWYIPGVIIIGILMGICIEKPVLAIRDILTGPKTVRYNAKRLTGDDPI